MQQAEKEERQTYCTNKFKGIVHHVTEKFKIYKETVLFKWLVYRFIYDNSAYERILHHD